jgi:lipoprotein signal peptidase
MATDLAVRRYRAWYAMLLRLYPRHFYDRFGEGMTQTFHDLCRERRSAGRRLFGFALGVFFETSRGIIRENTTHMIQMQNTVLRVALVALGLLMVPLVASRVVEGWNWGPGAFVFTYVLFFGTGMAYALIARKMNAWAYKAAVLLALVAGFVLGWATMVHMSETENPVNLVYFGVLAVGAVGAVLARLEARGMARALFAMAAALAVAWLITQVLSSDTPAGPVWNVGVMHGGFVALFAAAGLLFRRASLDGSN